MKKKNDKKNDNTSTFHVMVSKLPYTNPWRLFPSYKMKIQKKQKKKSLSLSIKSPNNLFPLYAC